ncbi:response regulator [Desulfobacter postgatei]|uniref:response regulator n=1 Tax=Desulfobacter postgatei TaxID=2293 RepID=UPI00259BE052|nr:response regulator [uncultured Desulfobacter sp.]
MQKNHIEYLNTYFLIVSYHSIIKSSIKQILKNNGFRNYLFARNGHEALKILQSHENKVEFIISDWDMPIINGIELLKKVKNDPELFMLPFMLLSKYWSVELRQIYAIEEDADLFMTIPFKEKDVINNILNCLNNFQHLTYEKKMLKKMIHNKLNNNYMEVLNLGAQLSKGDLSAEASILTGESLYYLKKYDQAKQVLKKSLSQTKNSKAYNLLGKIYSKQGDCKKSLENFKMAQKHNPLNISRSIDLIREYLLQGKIRRALELVSHILKSQPTYLDLIEIASLYLGAGYLAEAYKILKVLNPIDDTARVFYICCVKLWQKGAHTSALHLLKHCIDELPKNHLFLYYLGSIFLKKGQFQLANKYIRKVLDIHPDYEPAKRSIVYLKKLSPQI